MTTHRAPVFALAKASEDKTVAMAQGAYTITSVTTVANFPVDTEVWTSDGDNTKTQYRGLVTVSGGTELTVEIAAAAAADPGKLWKANASWQATNLHNAPESRRDWGVEDNRANDGTIYGTQVRSAIESILMRWDLIPTSDVDDLWTFIDDSISDGVDLFTLSWYDYRKESYRTATVKLINPLSVFNEQAVGVARGLTIEVVVQTENFYT